MPHRKMSDFPLASLRGSDRVALQHWEKTEDCSFSPGKAVSSAFAGSFSCGSSYRESRYSLISRIDTEWFANSVP